MFSKHNPRLQIYWDATSLGALQKCPRYYQLSILEGWRRPENEHLDFGGLFQTGVEIFQKGLLAGLGKEEATLAALRRTLQESGRYIVTEDGATWEPWGGHYVRQWRCLGTEPYRNDKGNKAKCPFSHKGKWFPVEGAMKEVWEHLNFPDDTVICNTCGSDLEIEEHYLPDHPSKNRRLLLKALLHFCDKEGEPSGLQPFAFEDGTPAIEIQTIVPLGRKVPCHLCGATTGACASKEDYLLVANLDEINTFRGRHFITDNKTTKDPLNDAFFRNFAPHCQFDFYDAVASIAFSETLDVAGLAVRGIQVTKTGTDIKTRWLTKTEGQREEFWRDLHWWISLAEKCAEEDYWPMNRASCRGCQFAGVCDLDPPWRGKSLQADFVRKPWNPITRGAPGKEEEDG